MTSPIPHPPGAEPAVQEKWPDMTITITQDEYEAFAAAIVVFSLSQPPPGQEDNFLSITEQHMALLDKLSAARHQARSDEAKAQAHAEKGVK